MALFVRVLFLDDVLLQLDDRPCDVLVDHVEGQEADTDEDYDEQDAHVNVVPVDLRVQVDE